MITLICGKQIMTVSDEEAIAILHIQKEMKATKWEIQEDGTTIRTDTGISKGSSKTKRVRPGNSTS
jgi:hypothetical protein